jgi:NAD(P)-dependent dehydrogenase (short-subunit alcohol dehydrogenase family)
MFFRVLAGRLRFVPPSMHRCGGATGSGTLMKMLCGSLPAPVAAAGGRRSLGSFCRRSLASSSTYGGGGYDDDDDEDDDASHRKTALVIGSSGSLGRTLSRYLSQELGVRVIGADVIPPLPDDYESNFLSIGGSFLQLPGLEDDGDDDGLGEMLQRHALVAPPPPSSPAPPARHPTSTASLSDLTVALVDGLSRVLGEDQDLDAIVTVAGAWEADPPTPSPPEGGDDLDGDDFDDDHRPMLVGALRYTSTIEGAVRYASTIERMMGKNLYPALAGGYASKHFMTDRDGLFVAIGATAALSATPGMLGYGLAKAATHHFVQTLGETTGRAVTTRSQRKLARRLRRNDSALDVVDRLGTMSVIGILPTTIDTPANRLAMPNADFSQWTRSIDIAKEIGMWMDRPALRPHSGSLVKVFPNGKGGEAGGGATFQLVR